jgi:hypothetical protein
MPGPGRPFKKGHKKLGGRKRGTPNVATTNARLMFEAAAAAIGGLDNLIDWIAR